VPSKRKSQGRRFFLSTYELKVLTADESHDDSDLEVIAYDITQGHVLGTVERTKVTEIKKEQLPALLEEMGNDGNFFDRPAPESDPPA
jgi:hypothetical protein